MNSPKSKQLGLSIFETMIAIIVFAVVLQFAMKLQREGDDQQDGRQHADLMSSFMQMAVQYVSSNRAAYESATKDGTGASTYCRINVNSDGSGGSTVNDTTLHTCAFDATLLRAQGVWPSGLSVDADGGGRYVAIFRQIYTGGNPSGALEGIVVHSPQSGALSAVTTADMKELTTKLQAGVAALGGSGGFIPIGDFVTCKTERASTTYQACGNGWVVNLSNFISSAQLTTFGNALPN